MPGGAAPDRFRSRHSGPIHAAPASDSDNAVVAATEPMPAMRASQMSVTETPEAIVQRLKADPAFRALKHSLDVYYGHPERDRAMDDLYRRFVKRGGLAFDIGSHVGDRIGAFRRIGARVVALEPQPNCARVIKEIYGKDPLVTVIEAACGPGPTSLKLHVNSKNPTVTTASPAFVKAADGADGWKEQTWDREIDAAGTTLDELIGKYGQPDFVKIDVEGFEADVLAGLSRRLPALSFEFTTIQRDVARACIEMLVALGSYGFDVALGESQTLTFDRWISAPDMIAHIDQLPHSANSGDVYAVLPS